MTVKRYTEMDNITMSILRFIGCQEDGKGNEFALWNDESGSTKSLKQLHQEGIDPICPRCEVYLAVWDNGLCGRCMKNEGKKCLG